MRVAVIVGMGANVPLEHPRLPLGDELRGEMRLRLHIALSPDPCPTHPPGLSGHSENHIQHKAFQGIYETEPNLFMALCRACGIPVREYYGIASGEAHAWPETYLEGRGWVKFEPTHFNETRLARQAF